jgi:hypothetical protein
VPKKRKSKFDPYRAGIVGWIGEQSDLTLAELCSRCAKTVLSLLDSSPISPGIFVSQTLGKSEFDFVTFLAAQRKLPFMHLAASCN